MEWKALSVGPLQTNGFVIWEQSDAVVIDPGAEPDRFERFLAEHVLDLHAILLTHGHGDHIGGVKELREAFPDAKVMCHREEAEFLTDPSINLSIFLPEPFVAGQPDRFLEHGEMLSFGRLQLEVRHVPGHTPGHIVFYHKAGGVLFAGDTVFAGGIGRCDLPKGNGPLLVSKVQSEILSLPDETTILPGHGPQTTLKTERQFNPYLQPDFDPGLLNG
ncbi:MBL fold metallo-hydrolase [bacterium]|nr:MBL fold metallo-hydrolase [bacterium]